MSKLSTVDLILEWLIATSRTQVSSHELQMECPRWIRQQGHKSRNPATVDRKWRNVKSECGLEVREITQQGDEESTWEIISLDGQPWSEIIGGSRVCL